MKNIFKKIAEKNLEKISKTKPGQDKKENSAEFYFDMDPL